MPADFEDVRYDVADHVATITLARPERMNAFRAETMRDFLGALDRADEDDDVRAVVVTGEGKAFSAGADISGGAAAFEPSSAGAEGARAEPPRDGGGILALRVNAMKKPMIAAINGAA